MTKTIFITLIFILFIFTSFSKPKWKQISGLDLTIGSFFQQNKKARVIWGYKDDIWHVACPTQCDDVLSKYMPLKNLDPKLSYWVSVNTTSNDSQEISSGLVGNWNITLKSANHWDNSTGTLSVSNEFSSTLTGHPILLSELGVKSNRAITKFEVSHLQIIEDSILQIDYMFYQEVLKTKEQLFNSLPQEIQDEIVDIKDKLLKNSYRTYPFDLEQVILAQKETTELDKRLKEIYDNYTVEPDYQNPMKIIRSNSSGIDETLRCSIHKVQKWGKREPQPVTHELVNSLFYKYLPDGKINNKNYLLGTTLYSQSGQVLDERIEKIKKVTNEEYTVNCENNKNYYDLIPFFGKAYFNIIRNEEKRIILQIRDGAFIILKKI
ncbi:MAG: hypothetical protein COB02_14650 [Candidatus Cloacimonadota bacterium]|nr:MAG: hypothetical protein COB02_14650 [Candidatus Cloacimonadota bacterium]